MKKTLLNSTTTQSVAAGLAPYQKYITDIHGLVFTVGFNRSGSSLMGDLLDGHPNVVMSNEVGVLRKYSFGEMPSCETLFSLIIAQSMNKLRKNFISGQDNYNAIKVIGDKHSGNNTFALIRMGTDAITQLKNFVKLPIKFLFTVRNPYDMVSSMITTVPDLQLAEVVHVKQAISFFARLSEKNKELMELLPDDLIFTIRNEEFISAPSKMLADICDFLGVEKKIGLPFGVCFSNL